MYTVTFMREVKLQTYWADCDPADIVYFPHFFRFIEMAEEELYRQAGTSRHLLLERYGIWLPRVEAHVKFVAPIRNGRAIRIRFDPQFQGQKTVKFQFEVLEDETGDGLAEGYMTVVCVDRVAFKSVAIPDEVRRAIASD